MSSTTNSTYALIMAGGEGTRFVPLSTPERPKQFLDLIGDKSFVRKTFERILPLVPSDRIYVSTNDKFVGLVKEHLPEIPAEDIIAEPQKKNTAPALAYATALIQRKDCNAIICCLPSDHFIRDEEGFRCIIERGISLANDGYLVTLGMRPTFASVEYGYIRPSDVSAEWSPAKQFTEKPKADVAQRYIDEGYLWNGGIFIWKASVFINELKVHAAGLVPSDPCGHPAEYFGSVASISIDYALMEKSSKVAVIPADIGWSDVGTWEGLYRLSRCENVAIDPTVASIMRGQLGYVLPEGAASFPKRIEKPWGYEEIWAHTGEYVGKILKIYKPHRLSYQYHRVKEETIRVLEGVMELEFGEVDKKSKIRLKCGDIYHIPPRTNHRMTAVEDCSILEVSTPYIGDVVRIEDDYGRGDK